MGVRVELDCTSEQISYKIRAHSHAKTPIIIAVGKKEMENIEFTNLNFDSKGPKILEAVIYSLVTISTTKFCEWLLSRSRLKTVPIEKIMRFR